ncbi:Flagellin N-methylase [Rubripirellula lacrimiformis]|uniref:Flagellin N-methylase n=1 Tax=Rubripirellula lacrimiformis TaxID=1930273 RepID=A0A517NK02_9BACT|nr:YkgJ family cysteine cluster protein [Rubripirellula lacrimiformis]QDT07458.1 Flagellin N-methylase [Rubripirellula lacrimiformis]
MEKQFECDQCGACCQGHLIVEVYDIDVLREPKLENADQKYARIDPNLPLAYELDQEGNCLIIACGSACSFLKENFDCAIYPTRPNVCVAMQAGSEQCQSARQSADLDALQPVQG